MCGQWRHEHSNSGGANGGGASSGGASSGGANSGGANREARIVEARIVEARALNVVRNEMMHQLCFVPCLKAERFDYAY